MNTTPKPDDNGRVALLIALFCLLVIVGHLIDAAMGPVS